MSKVIVPLDGSTLPGDFEVLVKVRSEHTNGVMSVIEETIPPRRLISPHTHQNDVWVYVLSGEIGVLVGDQIAVAGQGSWALKPRNVIPRATLRLHIQPYLAKGGARRADN